MLSHQRDIAMLFPRTLRLLVLEQLPILTQATTSGGRVDHIIHKAALRSHCRILNAFCVPPLGGVYVLYTGSSGVIQRCARSHRHIHFLLVEVSIVCMGSSTG